jgi:hypothetical protein
MSLPTFSFKQVEAVLARTFEIAPEKRKAWTARLQQLQRLGLPPGSNAGRGKRVAYQSWQLCDLQYYLDLIDAGVTPALIASRYSQMGFYTTDGAGRFGENAAKAGGSYFFHVRLNALEHLTLSGESLGEGSAAFNAYSGGRDLAGAVEYAHGEPGVLIDLGARLRTLRSAIAHEVPDLANVDLFAHLREE